SCSRSTAAGSCRASWERDRYGPRDFHSSLPIEPCRTRPPIPSVGGIPAATIEQGPWQPGDFFTTEEELQKTFQVSRATVRRALQQFMDEGLLERITGKGTFIARPPLRISLPHLVSFSEEITSRGMLPSTQVLNKGVVPVPDAVAEMLRMAPGSPVLRV